MGNSAHGTRDANGVRGGGACAGVSDTANRSDFQCFRINGQGADVPDRSASLMATVSQRKGSS